MGCISPWHGQRHKTKLIRKSCNLCCVFHSGMVDNMKQIRKCSNLDRVFHHGVVNDDEFSGFLCSCLRMVDETKLSWVTC